MNWKLSLVGFNLALVCYLTLVEYTTSQGITEKQLQRLAGWRELAERKKVAARLYYLECMCVDRGVGTTTSSESVSKRRMRNVLIQNGSECGTILASDIGRRDRLVVSYLQRSFPTASDKSTKGSYPQSPFSTSKPV